MKKSLMSLLVMVGMVILVGCDAGTNQVLPTLIPTLENTEVPTPTADITEAPNGNAIGLRSSHFAAHLDGIPGSIRNSHPHH